MADKLTPKEALEEIQAISYRSLARTSSMRFTEKVKNRQDERMVILRISDSELLPVLSNIKNRPGNKLTATEALEAIRGQSSLSWDNKGKLFIAIEGADLLSILSNIKCDKEG